VCVVCVYSFSLPRLRGLVEPMPQLHKPFRHPYSAGINDTAASIAGFLSAISSTAQRAERPGFMIALVMPPASP